MLSTVVTFSNLKVEDVYESVLFIICSCLGTGSLFLCFRTTLCVFGQLGHGLFLCVKSQALALAIVGKVHVKKVGILCVVACLRWTSF